MKQKHGLAFWILCAVVVIFGLKIWTEWDPRFEQSRARVEEQAKRTIEADQRACDAIMKQQAELVLADQGVEARKIDVKAVCERKEIQEAEAQKAVTGVLAICVAVVFLLLAGPILLLGGGPR